MISLSTWQHNHWLESYFDPMETYTTNIMGTVNLLEAARKCDNLGAIVNITTDKVYENNNQVLGYREIDPLGGYDPYSASKACSELISSSYSRSFFSSQKIGLATARAGNVIGGGDWSKGRLMPDIIRAMYNEDTSKYDIPMPPDLGSMY